MPERTWNHPFGLSPSGIRCPLRQGAMNLWYNKPQSGYYTMIYWRNGNAVAGRRSQKQAAHKEKQ
ncbi:MAG: hypothetical protein HFE85_02605 [Clostridiales bacterium]|nr:hypothetical protein [Clostridiales bacterium]